MGREKIFKKIKKLFKNLLTNQKDSVIILSVTTLVWLNGRAADL